MVWAAACSDGAADDDGGGADAGGGGDADPGAPDGGGPGNGYRTDLVGSIQLIERPLRNDVSASIRDRSPTIEERVVDTAGDCTVYEHLPTVTCEVPCRDGVCTTPDECRPFAKRRSAGPIQVTGLTEPLTFTPVSLGYTVEPYPTGDLFAAGAEITASAPGDEAPGFTVSARGVATLEGAPDEIELRDDADYELTWTPGSGDGDARIQVALRVGWHGAPYLRMLLCETADDGSLAIPRELIQQMPPAGSVGLFQWPSDITRYTRGIADTSAGPVELFVGSQDGVMLEH